jgi:hypothetical protein
MIAGDDIFVLIDEIIVSGRGTVICQILMIKIDAGIYDADNNLIPGKSGYVGTN